MVTLVYRFGVFSVDVLRAEMRQGDAVVPLRPKCFAMLEYLVEHADRLVTKDELLGAVWPNVVVTEDSLTRCISEVRAVLGDGAQQIIKTVARRGYVFAAPVIVENADQKLLSALDARPTKTVAADVVTSSIPGSGSTPAIRPSPPPSESAKRRFPPVGAAFAASLLGVALVWAIWLQHEPPAPGRMTLVVLPFTSPTGDPVQSALADSVSEDMTLALARLHGATVIATGTAFTYKGRAVDPKTVGAELGVRYVLQGSLLRKLDAIQVNAQLVETATAKSVWSDQIVVARVDWPRAQDEIVVRLANALDFAVVRADIERTKRNAPANLDAEDLAMQCAVAATVKQGESGAPSFELCHRALQIDPGNTRALVQLASYHGERVERMQSPDPAKDVAQARAWVDRALDADPLYYAAHCANATVLGAEHKVREALVAAERCEALNPSYARVYRILATLHFFLAEPEKSLDYAERGIRLSPRDPQLAEFMLFKGFANMMLRRDEEALRWLRQADAAWPGTPSILLPLTSALSLTGHHVDASKVLAYYLASKRTRLKTLAQLNYSPDGNPGFEAFADRYREGLRRAGMPEH